MVAYSFKRQFVAPIKLGLGLPMVAENFPGQIEPKRQTIRADRRRHARPGEELQLYCGMRTKGCFLIGRAKCVDAVPILIRFRKPHRPVDSVRFNKTERSPAHGIVLAAELDAFAVSDGFATWDDLRTFWRENHPGLLDFRGVLILWEPL